MSIICEFLGLGVEVSLSGVCIARARAEKLSLKSKPPPPPPGGSPDTVTTRGIITYSTCRARSPRDTYCDLCHCYRPPNGVHYLDCDACCAG